MIRFLFSILLISLSINKFLAQQTQFSSKDYSEYINATKLILSKYPESTLLDVYKYFFQNRFGPEHIISDSLIAFKILRDEIQSDEIKNYRTKPDSLLVELLYPEKKHVRVDLSLVKDRIIPTNLFFTAFINSVIKPDSLDYENWKKDWYEIVKYLEFENIKIKNFKEDKLKIENSFKQNRIVFSHSKEYLLKYKPHYRVIDYKIFEYFLLPYMKQFRIKFNY